MHHLSSQHSPLVSGMLAGEVNAVRGIVMDLFPAVSIAAPIYLSAQIHRKEKLRPRDENTMKTQHG
jgi:hypothetical protein